MPYLGKDLAPRALRSHRIPARTDPKPRRDEPCPRGGRIIQRRPDDVLGKGSIDYRMPFRGKGLQLTLLSHKEPKSSAAERHCCTIIMPRSVNGAKAD